MIHARQNKISWVSNTVGSSETLAIFKKTCHVYNDRCRSLSLADQTKAQRQRVPPLTLGTMDKCTFHGNINIFCYQNVLNFLQQFHQTFFIQFWFFFLVLIVLLLLFFYFFLGGGWCVKAVLNNLVIISMIYWPFFFDFISI